MYEKNLRGGNITEDLGVDLKKILKSMPWMWMWKVNWTG